TSKLLRHHCRHCVPRMSSSTDKDLSEELERIRSDSGATSVAVAFHDWASGRDFGHNAETWYHAASTIKVPTLVGVFAAVDAGIVSLDSRVHVRNRFISVADGRAFRVERGRDAG